MKSLTTNSFTCSSVSVVIRNLNTHLHAQYSHLKPNMANEAYTSIICYDKYVSPVGCNDNQTLLQLLLLEFGSAKSVSFTQTGGSDWFTMSIELFAEIYNELPNYDNFLPALNAGVKDYTFLPTKQLFDVLMKYKDKCTIHDTLNRLFEQWDLFEDDMS